MVVALSTHSCYSLLEGVPTPQELVDAAANRIMPALALTDHRPLTGAVEFALACDHAGLQPILGLEIDLAWAEGPRRWCRWQPVTRAGRTSAASAALWRCAPDPEDACPLSLVAPFSKI